MDFSVASGDTSTNVIAAVDRILLTKFSPAEKQRRISQLLRSVGIHFYNTMFGVVSYALGSEAMSPENMGSNNSQEERLANKIVRNTALGRTSSAALIGEYYDMLLGQSQYDAFTNARSMQRHPILTRTIVSETCKWCRDMADASPYVNPTGENFRRHHKCDCNLQVSGFRTRNGEVKNFKKEKKK